METIITPLSWAVTWALVDNMCELLPRASKYFPTNHLLWCCGAAEIIGDSFL